MLVYHVFTGFCQSCQACYHLD